MRYERVLSLLNSLDPKDWVALDPERLTLRADVRLQLVLEDVVDGEEIGDIAGALPDKYETWVLTYAGSELADYVFALMDRREASGKVVPFGLEDDEELVSLAHYNVGCLLYGKETMDQGLKEFKIRVAVQGGQQGLR